LKNRSGSTEEREKVNEKQKISWVRSPAEANFPEIFQNLLHLHKIQSKMVEITKSSIASIACFITKG
jgi:hypothetical protein